MRALAMMASNTSELRDAVPQLTEFAQQRRQFPPFGTILTSRQAASRTRAACR